MAIQVLQITSSILIQLLFYNANKNFRYQQSTKFSITPCSKNDKTIISFQWNLIVFTWLKNKKSCITHHTIWLCLCHVFSSYCTHLEERGANKRLFLIDGSGAEHVAGPQVERDVLDHVSQKLEVVNVADKVHAVYLREADKYVLWGKDANDSWVTTAG